jgi:hypothetical protein
MELWLPVSDFPNYEVSSNGRVRNKKRGNILKPTLAKGYPRVKLSDKNKCKPITVHRLVADAFYDGNHEGLQVNHINGDKTDNFIGNLEWVTGSENILHAYKTGLKTPPCPNPKRVRIVETGETFDSMAECARYINGSKAHVRECVVGIRTTHKGYHFEEI